jgi:crossover junction endodeoxyribonuclease RuvC
LLVTAVERRVSIAEYSPREIKLSVVGHGGATKEQVAVMVRRLLGLHEIPQTDAADALAAAVCHLHRARFTAPARALSAAAERLGSLLARSGRR